jgi:hypothetical protein
MPEFTVKEVRMPELHLPEIKRDEIVRALSGINIPDDVLTRVERRNLVPSLTLPAFPRRKRGLAQIDLGELVGAALAAVPLVRPAASRSRWSPIRRSAGNVAAMIRPAPRRSRRRFAILAIVAAVAGGWAILRDPRARFQLNRAARTARLRIEEMRAGPAEVIALEAGDHPSFGADELAVTIDDETTLAQAEAGPTAG